MSKPLSYWLKQANTRRVRTNCAYLFQLTRNVSDPFTAETGSLFVCTLSIFICVLLLHAYKKVSDVQSCYFPNHGATRVSLSVSIFGELIDAMRVVESLYCAP